MLATRVVPEILKNRLALGLAALALGLLAAPAAALAAPAPGHAPGPAVLTFRTMDIGSPNNPAVGVVPFTDGIYKTCAEAPAPKGPRAPACMEVGGVAYSYGIGELEVTVAQWVAFLNTVDPMGTDRLELWSEDESGREWPRFGQIDLEMRARPGHHYSLAAPEWADKPYGFANFLRAARFANALDNGKVLSRKKGTVAGYPTVTYRVRLSRNTGSGMYDMHKRAMTRSRATGFVIPSQDEWIKSAYYDPKGGGTYSYWQYPTNPGAFGQEDVDAPAQVALTADGDVAGSSTQPRAIFHEPKTEPTPTWCPSNQTVEACATVNPLGLSASKYAKAFAGSLGTVGTAGTRGPWGTLDQGGNAVEWTDTITKPPFGVKGSPRVWRRLHGGISNAPVYQLWLSAVGLQPQDNAFFTKAYPWLGIRIGVVGAP
jgi:hypothetical protein